MALLKETMLEIFSEVVDENSKRQLAVMKSEMTKARKHKWRIKYEIKKIKLDLKKLEKLLNDEEYPLDEAEQLPLIIGMKDLLSEK